MENHPQDDVLSRLAPEVRDYALPHFVLGDDLRSLIEVGRAAAWEAVVLYAARILEVLTAEALVAVELPANPNSFHNLDLLEQYNLMPTTTRYWAHALRRLGNDVRHIDRRITGDDAELAIGFVERVLHWFFCGFAHGQRLPSLTKDGSGSTWVARRICRRSWRRLIVGTWTRAGWPKSASRAGGPGSSKPRRCRPCSPSSCSPGNRIRWPTKC